MLASINCRSENVLVMPVIIAELELCDIQVLFADLVEGSDAATLDERPEAFDGLSVNRANKVLADAVIDGRVRIFVQAPIAGPLVGAKQTDLVRYSLAHERSKGLRADILDHAGPSRCLCA